MSEGISQSDLDALLGGLSFGDSSGEPEGALKMDDAWESLPVAEPEKGDILSQDDIDKMLAEFGRG
jgi:flagellar motor switch protein FliM